MASWRLAPCLDQFNKELEQIAPNRDHSSDGTIGDEAHQGTDSDHNPDENGVVCATDRDKDTNASFTMEDIVQYIVSECKKDNSVGKDKGRLNYIIYNKRIWRADGGWNQEAYTGSNPHDKHCHLSCEHDLKYVNDASSWGLVERFGGLPVDQAEYNKMQIASLKDPSVRAAYVSMFAESLLSKQNIYNYADGEENHSQFVWKEHVGAEEGTPLRNVLDVVVDIQKAINNHILGFEEGVKSVNPPAK